MPAGQRPLSGLPPGVRTEGISASHIMAQQQTVFDDRPALLAASPTSLTSSDIEGSKPPFLHAFQVYFHPSAIENEIRSSPSRASGKPLAPRSTLAAPRFAVHACSHPTDGGATHRITRRRALHCYGWGWLIWPWLACIVRPSRPTTKG